MQFNKEDLIWKVCMKRFQCCTDRCICIAVKCLALKESPKGKWSWISEYRQHSNLVQVHLAPAISFANMVSVSVCFLGRLPSIHCFPSIIPPCTHLLVCVSLGAKVNLTKPVPNIKLIFFFFYILEIILYRYIQERCMYVYIYIYIYIGKEYEKYVNYIYN